MKKLICLILVCLMLASVPVSAAEGPVLTGEIQTAMKTAFWNTYVMTPLSAGMKQEISDAWLAQKGTLMTTELQDLYYYGTYDGCVVFLEPLPATGDTTIAVAGVTIYWGSCYAVHVYRSGEFLEILEAYAQKWLSDSDIASIANLSGASVMQVEYYGQYDGCYVGFIRNSFFGYPEAELTVRVAGLDFFYSDYQQLTVCKDGQALDLDEAYEAGWLSDEEVQRLWNYYTNDIYEENPNGIYDENPDTGDGILVPVAMLVTSGVALLATIGRKKRI